MIPSLDAEIFECEGGSAIDDIIYTAEATVTGGRRGGHGETSDGNLRVELEPPGLGGSATNPEQLFAVGYAACFASAVGSQARRRKVDAGEVTVASTISLIRLADGFTLSAQLNVTLPSIEDPTVAVEIVRSAHSICPYSRATRGNIDVSFTANGHRL